MKKPRKLYTALTREEMWLGLMYLALELFVLPSLLSLGNGMLPRPLSGAVLNFGFFAINFVSVVVIFRKFLLKSLSMAGKHVAAFLQTVVLGFVAYWVSNALLGFLIGLALPGFSNPNDANIAQLGRSNFLLTAIGTVLLVPTAEECLYRGLVFRGLYGKSRVWAYCVSAALFSAIHVMGYLNAGQWLYCAAAFIQYIPAGLCLAWAYEKADSIFAPIVIHTAINAIGIYAVR